jgi:hypothetical protein
MKIIPITGAEIIDIINSLKSKKSSGYDAILIFWGNSIDTEQVCVLQKWPVRSMADVGSRTSYRSLFNKLDILPVPWQYRFSSMFIVDSVGDFQTNFSIHDVDTRNKTKVHGPITNFSCFQKGVSYAYIKIFSCLPSSISNPILRLHCKDTLLPILFTHLLNF